MNGLCRLLLIAAVLIACFTLVVFTVRFPGLAVLAVALLALARLRTRQPASDIHGVARWASEQDARDGGLL
jgi:hypothetical protein